ncbi:MAG: efflux RND transporter periplasmic adaptor subunit [Pirellulales bacterium]|nr:efflux RND transporter periplasmic adaptor subunit [Pirellulales bacterium]
MGADVDLRQLAIDRGESARPKTRAGGRVLTRYVLPGLLLAGFAGLIAWASRDLVFPPTAVTVVPVLASENQVHRSAAPLFQAAGWIEPRPTSVRVAALAPGVVEQLLVVEDEPVKAGQPVAELVKDDARLAHERAEADFRLREAELAEAKATLIAARTRHNQPVHLEAPLSEAQAALAKVDTELKNLPHATRRAEAEWELAKTDYEGKLASKGVVAGVEIDRAKRTLDSTKALVAELRERTGSLEKERAALTQRRDSLKTQLELLADETKAQDEAKAKIKAAQARVEQARVVVDEAKLRLDRMTVRSPIDGRVYQLVGEPGATLVGGMGGSSRYDGSTVVTLYRPDMLQVRVDVRFEDIPKVSLGQAVRIDNPALSDPLTGKVLFISSEADIQKNTLQVKVAIDSPPPVFKPEMLVDVTFLAPITPDEAAETSQQTRFYVPRSLIQQGEAGPSVWLADQSAGVARRVPVTLGPADNGELVEVVSGLTASSRLIASPIEGLSDGQRIRVVGETATSEAGVSNRQGSRTLNRLPQGEATHGAR